MNRLIPLTIPALILALAACRGMSQQELANHAEHGWKAVVCDAQLLPADPAQPGLEVGDIQVVQGSRAGARGYADLGHSLGCLEGLTAFEQPVDLRPYVFRFDVADGLDVEVPTRALSVAAGLTGVEEGSGTWTLHQPQAEEAGWVDVQSALKSWAEAHHDALVKYAPTDRARHRIRVITRVVRAEEATLVVRAGSPWAGKRWDGYDNAVAQVLDPVASPVDVEYRLDALNQSVAKNLRVKADEPGGVAVVSASSQTMTLVERLTHPMTVGYQVYEVPVGPDGCLVYAQAVGAAKPPPAIMSAVPAPE